VGSIHGYALAASLEQNFGWKPSQTAVYSTLKGLEIEKAVSVEEKIEKGRVQKIYSITDYGKEMLDENKDRIQSQMMKKLSQLVIFMENFSDIGEFQDFESVQSSFKKLMKDVIQISHSILSLYKVIPEETTKFVEATISTLNKMATDNNVEFCDFETKLDNT
jgi:DNA-binding PadR family transcriptional regulator